MERNSIAFYKLQIGILKSSVLRLRDALNSQGLYNRDDRWQINRELIAQERLMERYTLRLNEVIKMEAYLAEPTVQYLNNKKEEQK